MSHPISDLIRSLDTLDSATLNALRILALADAPVTLTLLKQAMADLKMTASSITTPWRAKMVKAELVELDGARMTINPFVAACLSQTMAAEGVYASMLKKLHKRFQHDYMVEQKLPLRNSNQKFYCGTDEERRALLNCPQEPFTYSVSLRNDYQRIFFMPMNPSWYAMLSEDVRFHILYSAMQYALLGYITVFSLDDIEQEISKHPGMMKHGGPAALLAEIALWRGDIRLAEQRIALLEDCYGWMMRGLIALMRGQYDNAIHAYETAIKLNPSGNLLFAYHATFYGLALLAKKETDKLKSYLTNILKQRSIQETHHAAPLQCLQAILAHREMREDFRETWLEKYLALVSPSPMLILLTALSLQWLQLPGRQEVTSVLLLIQDRLAYPALRWLIWQARQTFLACEAPRLSNAELKKIHGSAAFKAKIADADQKQNEEQWLSLLDLYPKEEAWERSLQALLAISAPAASKKADNRMVWLFSNVQDKQKLKLQREVEARQQTPTKSGAWSKGRKVALNRLFKSGDRTQNFPFLSPQDHRMCECIEQYQVNDWYYRETITEFNIVRLLKAAVGHPYLLINELSTPFHLNQDNIVVQVLREAEMIRIRLEPWPDETKILVNEEGDKESLLLHWETPQRLTIYDLNDAILHIARILGADGLRIPEEAQERALDGIAAIAPLLTVHSAIGGEGQQAAEVVEADHRLCIQLQPIGDGLQLSCFVRPFGEAAPLLLHPAEGGKTVFTEHAGRTLQTERDLKAENAVTRRLFTLASQLNSEEGWHWQLDDAEAALGALEGIQELGEDAVLEWPEDRKITLGKKLQLSQMKVSVHKQQDWFNMEGEIEVNENQVVGIKQLMELMDASKSRFVRLDNDQFINLSDALYKRLSAMKSITDGGRFHGLAAGAMEDVLDGMDVRKNKHWQSHLKTLRDAQEFQAEVPSTLQAELRDYQVEGFRWMARLAHWGAGACLADDMGLGKTIQTLALILSHAPEGPTLVVAPTSVGMNWEDEANRFAPTLRIHRFSEGDREALVKEVGSFDLVVCSYGLLQRNDELLASRAWQTVVLDEAQAIKNTFTKRSKAAMSLEAKVRVITTGTPIENHLGELWNLFEFINPGLLGSLESFNRRFANPIQVQEDKEAAQRLRQLVQPFMLRRLKRDVLTELPPRTEITVHVDLSGEELALYEATRRQAIERIQQADGSNPGEQRIKILAEIMRLRRACCHPTLVMPESTISGSKLAAFAETIDELRENNHKALVFSQFVGHLEILRKHLDEKKIPYQYLDGSTPAPQRKKRVDAFQSGEGDVFLISLKAGGAGLNLTAADYVLHMDPWWNPAVEDQASDRAHRMGQLRPVTIYRFIARNTIEDKIVTLHQQKRDLADSLLQGSDSSGSISLQEIMKLVEESSLS